MELKRIRSMWPEAPQGRQAKPFGTTPTAPSFEMPEGGSLTGRGGARRGAELGLTAPQPTQPNATLRHTSTRGSIARQQAPLNGGDGLDQLPS